MRYEYSKEGIMRLFIPFFVSLCLSVSLFASCSEPEENETPQPAPVIESIVSKFDGKAVYDQVLEIHGSNFSTESYLNTVYFDDQQVNQFVDVSQTVIRLKAPRIDKETVTVKVETDGQESETMSLEYDRRRCDSVLLFQYAKVEEIRKDIVWTSTLTTWYGEPRSLNVLSVKLSGENVVGISEPSALMTVSAQCKAAGAVVGVNASYFKDGHTRDFLRLDGEVVQVGEAKRSKTFAGGVFCFDGNEVAIMKVESNVAAADVEWPNVLCSGPLLIDDGEFGELVLTSTHNTEPHPRTAVGITEDGRLLLVTVDGRLPGKAVGMPSSLMQEYMRLLGARYALNLDGGGSTTMWIEGRGVVNHACDDLNWNSPQEREVASVIFIK